MPVIDGGTSLGAAWWLVGPVVADWWPLLAVGSVVLVLAVVAGVNLAMGRIVGLFAPPVYEVVDGDGESAETVPLPPAARRKPAGQVYVSFTCAPASDQTVMLTKVRR